MACEKSEVACSSIGSVKMCECGMITVECNGGVIEIPRAAFSSFAGLIDVACANIISRGLAEAALIPCACRK